MLTPAAIELLFRSTALHDIGKAGIPDRILLKPGKLSAEEFEIMKTHTTLGRDAVANAKRALGVDVDYLDVAREIACSHHEKWDGKAIAYADSHADLRKKEACLGIARV